MTVFVCKCAYLKYPFRYSVMSCSMIAACSLVGADTEIYVLSLGSVPDGLTTTEQ